MNEIKELKELFNTICKVTDCCHSDKGCPECPYLNNDAPCTTQLHHDKDRLILLVGQLLIHKKELERPTAEWILRPRELQDEIEVANGNYSYECSNCKHGDLQSKSVEVPYCWFCGAKMKKEKVNNPYVSR